MAANRTRARSSRPAGAATATVAAASTAGRVPLGGSSRRSATASTSRRSPGRTAHVALPAPRPTRTLETDLAIVATGFVALVLAMWARHGGLAGATDGVAGATTALAQLSGLLASTAGLAGVALAGRPRTLDQRFGLDRMLVWHRVLGETMAVLVGVHVAAGVAEWSVGAGVLSALRDLTGRAPYMAGATVGAALVGVVTVSSLRSIRRRFSYETWYFIHLTAYGALALSFSHEIVTGSDLASDLIARWIWVAAHVAVVATLMAGRWWPLLRAAVRPLRVIAVEPLDARGEVTSIVLGGPGLGRVRADAGQFLFVRPLASRLWWQAHPFSLSAAPSSAGLRLTVKRRGDASHAIADLPVGTKVAIEGPYGSLSPADLAGRKVLFVAGGVGIAPVRAMLERLDATAQPIVLYRAHHEGELVHLDELRSLAASRGGRVEVLVGPRASLSVRDPFGAAVLRQVVPDVTERACVLCGPEGLLQAARAGLLACGVRRDDVHYDRVWW